MSQLQLTPQMCLGQHRQRPDQNRAALQAVAWMAEEIQKEQTVVAIKALLACQLIAIHDGLGCVGAGLAAVGAKARGDGPRARWSQFARRRFPAQCNISLRPHARGATKRKCCRSHGLLNVEDPSSSSDIFFPSLPMSFSFLPAQIFFLTPLQYLFFFSSLASLTPSIYVCIDIDECI